MNRKSITSGTPRRRAQSGQLCPISISSDLTKIHRSERTMSEHSSMSTLTRVPDHRSATLSRTRVLSPPLVPSSTITLGFISKASAYSVRRWSEMSVRLSDWRIVTWISSDRLPDKGGGVIFLASDAFHSLAKSSVTVHIKSRASFRGSAERTRAPACILVRAAVQREALMMDGVSCFPFLQDTPEGPAPTSESFPPRLAPNGRSAKLSSQVFELTLGISDARIGATSASIPASSITLYANSYYVHDPLLVAWNTPRTSDATRFSRACAACTE